MAKNNCDAGELSLTLWVVTFTILIVGGWSYFMYHEGKIDGCHAVLNRMDRDSVMPQTPSGANVYYGCYNILERD